MNILNRYIGSSFLGGCIPVILMLLSLFSFLALSEELEDVGKGSYELVDALLVVACGLPALAVNLLPVTVLLGGLLGLGALANNLELTAMRAAAVSTARICVPIIQLSLAIIGVVLLLQSLVIPKTEFFATQLRGKTLIEENLADFENETAKDGSEEFWTRNAGQFIRFDKVMPDRSLAGVEIYQFDEQAVLQKILQTPRAELLQDNTWLLHQVRETTLHEQHAQTELQDTLLWQALLSEDQTRTLMTSASSLSPADLWRSIRRLEENNMNAESQRVIFWTQMSIPVGILAMALMALPFLLGSVRSVSVGQRIAMGGIIGISYYLIQQISGHLAGIMHWNVVLTVLSPGLLLLVIAIVLLKRSN